MSEWIEVGQEAPELELPSDRGETVTLSAFRGRPVVLYFYPKDDTPGCTREACAFRDRQPELAARSAVVLGVSPDDVASHVRFRDRFDLGFPLLADVDHAVASAYGAWRERNLYGKRFMGVQRSTFLIDAAGIVRKVWKRVKVEGHDAQVIAALDAL